MLQQIDMLQQNSTQSNEFHSFMHHYSMETKITTIYGSHVDHIWTNAPSQQYMFDVVEAYWTDHKPIYLAFKISDYVNNTIT